MKRLLLVLINLLSYASPSVAVLDDLFVRDAHRKTLPVKNPEDFRSKNPIYQGISNLHPGQPPYVSRANYPKVPLIRPYYDYWFPTIIPFVASLHKAHAPSVLENIHSQQLPNHTKVYSFSVQSMQDENEGGTAKLHRVVPHYFVHPNAPAYFQGRNYVTNLKWTAVPGDKGHVTPANANNQNIQLLPDSISTHNHPHGVMLTSADVMHLQGVHHRHSVDLTSLVAFTDENNNNISAITYHWLLNNEDLNIFSSNLANANTLRELITSLEPLDNFKNLVGELKRYIDFSPIQEPLPAPQLPPLEQPAPQEQKESVKASQRPIVEKPIPQKQVSPSPSKNPALQTKSAPVRTNAKAAPIRRSVTAPVPSIVQKPVAQRKASSPTTKAGPVRTNAKAAPKKAAVSVKKVLTPATKKATVIVKKILASKIATRKAPVHKVAPKKALIHKPVLKKTPPRKTSPVRTKASRAHAKTGGINRK